MAFINTNIALLEELEIAPFEIDELRISDFIKIINDEVVLQEQKLNVLKLNEQLLGDDGLKWNKVQRKNNFVLSEEDQVMFIEYSSCYNANFCNKTISKGYANVKFHLETLDISKHCCIGVVNENFDDSLSCFCEGPKNCFLLYADGLININGDEIDTELSFLNVQEVLISINLDLNGNIITFGKNELKSPPFNLSGEKFRFVVGMCNNGLVTYKILESEIL